MSTRDQAKQDAYIKTLRQMQEDAAAETHALAEAMIEEAAEPQDVAAEVSRMVQRTLANLSRPLTQETPIKTLDRLRREGKILGWSCECDTGQTVVSANILVYMPALNGKGPHQSFCVELSVDAGEDVNDAGLPVVPLFFERMIEDVLEWFKEKEKP